MGYTRKYPNNIAYGGSSVLECITNDDKDIKNLYEIISKEIGIAGSANGSRQCVLSGKFTPEGKIGFLTSNRYADKPYVGIACEEVPAIIDFANGFNESGAKDIIKKLDSHNNTAWELEDDETVYLYIDCSISTGAITFGHTSYEEVYAYAAPGSPKKDQCWFDKGEGVMKCFDGSAWQKVLRLFVAKVTTQKNIVPTIEPFYAASRLDAHGEIQLAGDTITFMNGGNLKSVKAQKFIGTADKALSIPVGRGSGGNIWIEEVAE